MDPIRGQKEYEGNPVGLSEKACSEMREHLDRHLAAFWLQYAQYHKHHWLVEGPQFRDIHLFLEENYNELHEHLDAIAERITLLGFSPTTRLENYVNLAYVEQEPEGVYRIRDGIQLDMKNEKTIATELRKSIKRALELEDFGTKKLLEDMLFRAEDRAHHCEHFLGEDSLSVGFLHQPAEVQHN
jgi:DNA-binding ferritin-like protein